MTKKNIEEILLNYAINKGVDLWIFKNVFTDLRYDYLKYCEMWKDASRVKLGAEEYIELQKIIKEYISK